MIELLNLAQFEIQPNEINTIAKNTFFIKKWNWDYSKSYAFQKHCVQLLQEHPQLKVLIACNHPHVFTNGRGLQKPRKGQTFNLIEFDPARSSALPFPLFQIERGGGLTFHHPGQFIFYPILKLNPKELALSKLIDEMLKFSQEILETWGLKEIQRRQDLLGLWVGDKKIASLGIAIERLTTFHGMALNMFTDIEMNKALKQLNPCGLSVDVYSSVQAQLPSLSSDSLDDFCQKFMQKIAANWMEHPFPA